MSATASFICIPKTTLDELRRAATPKKRWFGKPKDQYWEFLKQHGREVSEYKWSGFILATLLCHLQKQKIDLMHSDFDELSTFLTKKRGFTHCIFTEEHKQAHLPGLDPAAFSEQALRDYYNAFNGASEPDIGKPMLDGIRAIQESLQRLEAGSVVVLIIG